MAKLSHKLDYLMTYEPVQVLFVDLSSLYIKNRHIMPIWYDMPMYKFICTLHSITVGT